MSSAILPLLFSTFGNFFDIMRRMTHSFVTDNRGENDKLDSNVNTKQKTGTFRQQTSD